MPTVAAHRPSPRARLAAALFGLAAVVSAVPAVAQPVGDRSEIEERKRLEEEKARLRREAEVKETDEQREARERVEKREVNAKEALKRAQAALQAAAARQNKKGMELMQAAWMLDPTNIDYSFNTAAFAEALAEFETEFRAHAQVKLLAKKAIEGLPDGAPQRAALQGRLDKALDRLEFLRTKVGAGVLRITSDPKSCEVFLEGSYVGMGGGEIDALTGQRKAETKCIGFHDHELFVNVREGDPSVAVIKPKPIAYFGKLILRVEPSDGVTVFLDDVPIPERLAEKATKEGKITGKGTKQEPFQLAARKWIIRFQKEGYDRWHRRIEVRRDQAVVVEARLELLSETIEGAAQ